MMSCILLGIFAASLVVQLISKKDLIVKLIGIILLISLTSTGVYDFITVIRKNRQYNPLTFDLNSQLTAWVDENSSSQDIFLTSSYTINELILGGAMIYQGHQYYAWSAGYDTHYRDLMVKQMYEAETSEELDTLVKDNNIRYIVVDRDNRTSEEYRLNEENISRTYQRVYEEGEDECRLSIYDTKAYISDQK